MNSGTRFRVQMGIVMGLCGFSFQGFRQRSFNTLPITRKPSPGHQNGHIIMMIEALTSGGMIHFAVTEFIPLLCHGY